MQTIFKAVYQDNPLYVKVAQAFEQWCSIDDDQPVVVVTHGQIAQLVELPDQIALIEPFVQIVNHYAPNTITTKLDITQAQDHQRLVSLQNDDTVPVLVNNRIVVNQATDITEFDTDKSKYAYVATTYYVTNCFYQQHQEE